jgi:molecular chaperone HscB
MTAPDFQQTYFQLFDLPGQFELDNAVLGAKFRQLQGQLHPDRFTSKSQHEQRVAVQYSTFVNQAYTTLRKPLDRAYDLLQLAGMSAEQVSGEKVDGGFIIEQMVLR